MQRLILANVRTPAERRGDLNAQLAALRIGTRRIEEVAQRFGREVLKRGLAAILDYSERRMRRRLQELPPGIYEAEDRLDEDGSSDGPVVVKVRVEVFADRLVIDFAGSSLQRMGNVNAVAPMTQSASFFSLKFPTSAKLGADRVITAVCMVSNSRRHV